MATIDIFKGTESEILLGEPEQFSSRVSRFVGRAEYVIEALVAHGFAPRYTVEDMRYLGLNGIESLTIAMVCFCDIPVSRLEKHATPERYGEFGIELTKSWAISKGLQPVHYLNPRSPFVHDLRQSFEAARSVSLDDACSSIATIRDFVVTQLVYSKPLYEASQSSSDPMVCREDECEWRYVPSKLGSTCKLLYTHAIKGIDLIAFNNVLKGEECARLSFNSHDVTALLVSNPRAEKDLHDAIMAADLDSKEKSEYLAKVKLMKGGYRDRKL